MGTRGHSKFHNKDDWASSTGYLSYVAVLNPVTRTFLFRMWSQNAGAARSRGGRPSEQLIKDLSTLRPIIEDNALVPWLHLTSRNRSWTWG